MPFIRLEKFLSLSSSLVVLKIKNGCWIFLKASLCLLKWSCSTSFVPWWITLIFESQHKILIITTGEDFSVGSFFLLDDSSTFFTVLAPPRPRRKHWTSGDHMCRRNASTETVRWYPGPSVICQDFNPLHLLGCAIRWRSPPMLNMTHHISGYFPNHQLKAVLFRRQESLSHALDGCRKTCLQLNCSCQ